MTDPVFNKITIIGIGLLGSSIAHGIKAYGGAGQVDLYDRDDDVRALAAKIVPGQVCDDIADAVSGADAVFLCTPVGVLGEVTAQITPHLKPGAILTDVGSVKEAAARDMQVSAPGVHVIPGHPIAGTEKSGPDAGFASLFQDAWHILTPMTADAPAGYDAAVTALSTFWTGLGAKVEQMDAARHDRVLAITSHLPHLIAYNIVSTAYDMESVAEGEVVKYSAGGFRDFTRIAASDPTMWRDVFLANKSAVLETLGRFGEDLAVLQRAIRHGDGETLMREFTRARGIRKAIIDAGLDTAEADFGRRTGDTDAEE